MSSKSNNRRPLNLVNLTFQSVAVGSLRMRGQHLRSRFCLSLNVTDERVNNSLREQIATVCGIVELDK